MVVIVHFCYVRCSIFNYIKSLFGRTKKAKNQSNKPHREHNSILIQATETEVSAPLSPKRKINKEKQAHILHKEFVVSAEKYGISTKDFPKNAIAVINKLTQAGYEAYIVGGAIRDLLMEKNAKDVDIATNARPEEIQKVFGRQCRIIGRRFRLAHIVYGREIYEVATFRASHHEGHNEKISKTSEAGMLLRDNVYGTLREDAERRDFSINALYYDVHRNVIFDFFDGIADLKSAQLRLIGSPITRYQEDPVRMLRAIRFMAKLDFFLHKETGAPIKSMAHLLRNIPPARLFEESLKLLQAGAGLKTYELLRKYGLFEPLFPLLTPFFTDNQDSYCEKMIHKALSSTDERLRDGLSVNPAFLFATLFWYPLREKIDELKNEGGLNAYDAMMLAANEILSESNKAVALHRRYTTVIREIWALQFQFPKRTGKRPLQTLEQVKFRAGFDLLVMRAEIEGGDLIELSAWWHEFQFSNDAQRAEMLKAVASLPSFKMTSENDSKKKRKPRRRSRYKSKTVVEG